MMSFILTKWYVNLHGVPESSITFLGFILTKWYVNKMGG
ncbi:hypothetical protein QUI_3162 [Clostridioides difficile P59]|nr:hypothetical protein QUI_3162 [Clostridioides difficile P59]